MHKVLTENVLMSNKEKNGLKHHDNKQAFGLFTVPEMETWDVNAIIEILKRETNTFEFF